MIRKQETVLGSCARCHRITRTTRLSDGICDDCHEMDLGLYVKSILPDSKDNISADDKAKIFDMIWNAANKDTQS